ncbi:MAG: PKD domain-containing protein [Sphingobacteriales bacterium]|nr:MAG: PKD domain-containing protein [Sphingobacteriales bacterium]
MSRLNFDRKFYLPVVGILLTAVLALLARHFITFDKEVVAKISKNKLAVNEPFSFEDNSTFARKWKWEFGDGVISYDRGGRYQYPQSGNYQIRLTINEEQTDTFFVSVRDTVVVVQEARDSIARIDGPSVGMQFENLIFRAEGRGARLFRWDFGDNQNERSSAPFVFHTYEKPGNYVVSLYTDINTYPISLTVKVLPAFETAAATVPSGPTPTESLNKIDDDFKLRLQQIADHKNFDANYRYLLNQYLCGKEKVVVTVNGQKYNEFFTYCAGLHYDKNIFIQEVKTSVDTSFHCVTRVEVTQQSQSL